MIKEPWELRGYLKELKSLGKLLLLLCRVANECSEEEGRKNSICHSRATAEVASPTGWLYSSALTCTSMERKRVLCGTLPGGVQEDVTLPCPSGLFLSLPPSNRVELPSHPRQHRPPAAASPTHGIIAVHPRHRPPTLGAHMARRRVAVTTAAETPSWRCSLYQEKEPPPGWFFLRGEV